MSALYYFDALITGSSGIKDLEKISKNKLIISSLLRWKNKGKKNDIPFEQYIYDTFDAFIQNKEHIVVDLTYVEQADKKMGDLIVYGLEICDEAKEDDDKTNLLREETMMVFANVKSVVIQTTELEGDYQFALSLLSLLCLIKRTLWQQVIVKAVTPPNKDNNWISSVWSSTSTAIKQQYQSKHYNISLKHIANNGRGFGYKEDWLIIDKM